MMRRRNVPWIHRFSRVIIGAIAVVGFILTAYLTISKLTGGEVACGVDAAAGGCTSVLDSAYAYPFDPQGKTGPPLSLFGAMAYLAMGTFALSPYLINGEKQKELRKKVENWTWWLLLLGAFAMATMSIYLMYVLAFKLQTVCYYCIGSAIFSFSLLTLTLLGREWPDSGQVAFTGGIIIVIMLVTLLGLYSNANTGVANANTPTEIAQADGKIIIPRPTVPPKAPKGWEITTTSGESEIALAKHLTKIGAIDYSAYWCPHCYDQKQLFGKEAFKEINMIECIPEGENGQPQKCIDAKIKGFPTWIINGKVYEGTQTLQKLAEVSGYKGPTNFKYKTP